MFPFVTQNKGCCSMGGQRNLSKDKTCAACCRGNPSAIHLMLHGSRVPCIWRDIRLNICIPLYSLSYWNRCFIKPFVVGPFLLRPRKIPAPFLSHFPAHSGTKEQPLFHLGQYWKISVHVCYSKLTLCINIRTPPGVPENSCVQIPYFRSLFGIIYRVLLWKWCAERLPRDKFW